MDQTKLFAPLTRKAKKLSGFRDKNTARKAGSAGKGQAKRRGDTAYYKALSAIAVRARLKPASQAPEES